jgi:hypothetical protein
MLKSQQLQPKVQLLPVAVVVQLQFFVVTATGPSNFRVNSLMMVTEVVQLASCKESMEPG